MNESEKHLSSVVEMLREANNLRIRKTVNVESISDHIAAIFSLGEYCYFILDFFDFGILYTNPTVQNVYGCPPEEFSLQTMFGLMHPEDAMQMQNKESAAREFFYSRITPDKIMRYKSSYTFRIQDGRGGWKMILHQSLALQLSDEDRIQIVVVTHTDVTHLNLAPDSRISFIGIHGEPSFYALSTDPENILGAADRSVLSKREIEIVRLLAQGQSSKLIGSELFISTHTVDTHRRNMMRRMGVANTQELVARCIRMGVL